MKKKNDIAIIQIELMKKIGEISEMSKSVRREANLIIGAKQEIVKERKKFDKARKKKNWEFVGRSVRSKISGVGSIALAPLNIVGVIGNKLAHRHTNKLANSPLVSSPFFAKRTLVMFLLLLTPLSTTESFTFITPLTLFWKTSLNLQ